MTGPAWPGGPNVTDTPLTETNDDGDPFIDHVATALMDALCETVWAGRHIGELEEHLTTVYARAALDAVLDYAHHHKP